MDTCHIIMEENISTIAKLWLGFLLSNFLFDIFLEQWSASNSLHIFYSINPRTRRGRQTRRLRGREFHDIKHRFNSAIFWHQLVSMGHLSLFRTYQRNLSGPKNSSAWAWITLLERWNHGNTLFEILEHVWLLII